MNEYAERGRQLEYGIKQYEGTDPWELAELLTKAMKESYEANRVLDALPRDAGNTRQRNNACSFIRHKEWIESVLQRRLAVDFGAQYGWKLSRFDFGLRTLSQGKMHGNMGYGDNPYSGSFHAQFAHPYYYRQGRKAAAIAAHLYGYEENREACLGIAAAYNLRFCAPDFPSWCYPGSTVLVVYIGAAGGEVAPQGDPRDILGGTKSTY